MAVKGTHADVIRMPSLLRVVAGVVVGLGALVILQTSGLVTDGMRNEIGDSFRRPFAPHYDLPPDSLKAAKQDNVIGEYTRRGYKLNCYGNLRAEERIAKDDDYSCWALVKAAYDNIPAKMVIFLFHKGELQHVKIEFPESSFRALQGYLSRRLALAIRLDGKQSTRFGTDIYGKSLMTWITDGGLVVTSSEPTRDQPITLLWISKEAETRRICTEWERRRDVVLERVGDSLSDQLKGVLRHQQPPLPWMEASCRGISGKK